MLTKKQDSMDRENCSSMEYNMHAEFQNGPDSIIDFLSSLGCLSGGKLMEVHRVELLKSSLSSITLPLGKYF